MTKYKQDYLGLLCRQGKLKGEKFGRNWVTTKEWILDYIKKIESKGEEIIPVKIIKFREDNEETKTKKSNIGYPKIGKLLPIGGFLLAALAISVVAGGFIFTDKKLENSWSGKRAAAEFVISERVSKTLRYRSRVSPKLEQEIISLSDSLNLISDYGGGKLGNWKLDQKIVALIDSLNVIESESHKFAERKILAAFDSRGAKPRGGGKQEIISLSNSLNIISDYSDEKFGNLEVWKSEFLPRLDGGFPRDEFSTLSIAVKTAWNKNRSQESVEFYPKLDQEIISLSSSLNIISDHSKGAVRFSFNDHSTRVKNNVKNLTEPFQNKLAELSRSKDTIVFAVFEKTKRGRVAGIFTGDESAPPASSHKNKRGIRSSVISLSDSLDGFKNSVADFAVCKISDMDNSIKIIKSEAARFAFGEADKLYGSCDLLKNKSAEKIKLALNNLDGGGTAEKDYAPAAKKSDGEEADKSIGEIDELEKEIIGDVQKRFREFRGDLSMGQDFGAAVIPYSDLDDKEKKIKNLKESFSDEVEIEKDEDGGTGTIIPDIPGAEEQSYLYLMVPMGK